MVFATHVNWGDQIRQFRRIHALKQSALAEMVGVDQATISRWEKNATIPSLGLQRRLRDMMRAAPDRGAAVKHGILISTYEVSITSAYSILLAASRSYCASHGVSQRDIVGISSNPMATEEASRVRTMTNDMGFFRGALASVTTVMRVHSLSGHRRNSPTRTIWTPTFLPDGRILRHVERATVSDSDFERALEDNGGPVRIVTMDELVG